MNKINIQNKLYFVMITTINILFITLLMFSLDVIGSPMSLLIKSISFGIVIILSLCSGVFLFKNKNKIILKKDLKPLCLFIIFSVVIVMLRLWAISYFEIYIYEELIDQMFNYQLSFLIIPNILLNIYSILMSVDKK